ncbi:cytochrome c3 family protein [Psychromonas hadalis]|uniref:cytochrome c3 family protein n=1 Tax=Psychromonas hadalis TaxID=211669 RepID=UPI0003B5B598|nr:cytochrome c3 family protein [Psychromonas hadalis]
MKSLLLFMSLFFSIMISAEELPSPDDDNLANLHLKDQQCAQGCHAKEGPSEELEFKNNSCIECHDQFGYLAKAHNLKHQEEEILCLECHLPHEEEKPAELCADCHEADHDAFNDNFLYKKKL